MTRPLTGDISLRSGTIGVLRGWAGVMDDAGQHEISRDLMRVADALVRRGGTTMAKMIGVRTWWAWRRTGTTCVRVSTSKPRNSFSRSGIMSSMAWEVLFGRLPKAGAPAREYRTELVVRKAGKFAKRKARK